MSRIVTAVGSVMAGGLLAAPVLVSGAAAQTDVGVVAENQIGDGNRVAIDTDGGDSIVAGAYKKLGALDPTSL